MKKAIHKLLPVVSNIAFATAFVVIGSTCRSWLYQPKLPDALKDVAE